MSLLLDMGRCQAGEDDEKLREFNHTGTLLRLSLVVLDI